ncbi:MAG: ParB N-terminal domain-containing protein [Turicibacter sp.]|nr:ParB N-terminal domain-containing protein [Turicibacter sp.]
MAKKTDIFGSLNKSSLAETRHYQPSIKQIERQKIVPNPLNFYNTDDITDIKASIKASGLLQNLVVQPHGEQYMLISGHRRFKAITDGRSQRRAQRGQNRRIHSLRNRQTPRAKTR